MRLDKYLQLSRLVKRRTLAQQLCDAGKVWVNDRRGKPATIVAGGDVLDVNLGPRQVRLRITRLPSSPKEAAAVQPYEILRDARRDDWT